MLNLLAGICLADRPEDSACLHHSPHCCKAFPLWVLGSQDTCWLAAVRAPILTFQLKVTFAQVWLVAVDTVGNAQAVPTLVPVQTAPDTSPPALLAGSGPGSVSSCT